MQGIAHQPIRVGMADDHLIVRSALRQFFNDQPDVEVVAECGSGRGVIDMIRNVGLDVLILDISMPDQSGLDCMSLVRAKVPEVGILVLSSHPAEQYAMTALRQGASGYLNKQCEPEEILEAVRVIGTGKRYMQPELVDLLARNAGPKGAGEPHEALSEREFQVMLKLAQGASSSQIGEELSLTAKTVSSYRSKLLRKLELHSNSELTHYALKHRLID